jgi:hypothetical protein
MEGQVFHLECLNGIIQVLTFTHEMGAPNASTYYQGAPPNPFPSTHVKLVQFFPPNLAKFWINK